MMTVPIDALPLSLAQFRIRLQVGVIQSVEDAPGAKKPAYRVQVDLGTSGRRGSSVQATNYPKEALLGRQVVCVTNLPPRRIAGYSSELLVLGAPGTDGQLSLLELSRPALPGALVYPCPTETGVVSYDDFLRVRMCARFVDYVGGLCHSVRTTQPLALEAVLLGAIRDKPEDPAPWLALADWLEERGEIERAQLVRTEQQRRARVRSASEQQAVICWTNPAEESRGDRSVDFVVLSVPSADGQRATLHPDRETPVDARVY